MQSFGKNFSKSEHLNELFPPLAALHVHRLAEIPLEIVTYLERTTLQQEHDRMFFPLLFKWFGSILFIIILLYVFCYRILKQNRQLERIKIRLESAAASATVANTEKEKTMRYIQSKLKEPFVKIVTYAEILLKYFKQEIDLELSSKNR